ncbi:MAG: class II aldolase/adducin family protein [Candidatus Gastranaerophilales bacterium]|nr:class II aldolase/adducin family protein [Candidatus Gastranaerophilales bacterium]
MNLLKKELSYFCNKIYKNGFSPGTSGNVSIRKNNSIFITSSGLSFEEINEKNISTITINGISLDKDNKPSSEKFMHTQIYEIRPDITAIIHIHSPKIAAFATSDANINTPILAETIIHLGNIPKAPYAMPSSDELAINVANCCKENNVVFMANHGAVVLGKTLREAYYQLETLQAACETFIWANLIGNAQKLPKEKVDELIELKKRLKL